MSNMTSVTMASLRKPVLVLAGRTVTVRHATRPLVHGVTYQLLGLAVQVVLHGVAVQVALRVMGHLNQVGLDLLQAASTRVYPAKRTQLAVVHLLTNSRSILASVTHLAMRSSVAVYSQSQMGQHISLVVATTFLANICQVCLSKRLQKLTLSRKLPTPSSA
jgi:hypothetical protein